MSSASPVLTYHSHAAPSGSVTQVSVSVARSQPTVSHHPSLLVDVGFLTREKRGRWAWHRVDLDRLRALAALLQV